MPGAQIEQVRRLDSTSPETDFVAFAGGRGFPAAADTVGKHYAVTEDLSSLRCTPNFRIARQNQEFQWGPLVCPLQKEAYKFSNGDRTSKDEKSRDDVCMVSHRISASHFVN